MPIRSVISTAGGPGKTSEVGHGRVNNKMNSPLSRGANTGIRGASLRNTQLHQAHPARSEFPTWRMSLEQVPELEIFSQEVEPLVPAEPLQLGTVAAAFPAGDERATLDAVTAEVAPIKAGADGAGLNDLSDGLGRNRGAADAGQGRGRPAAVAVAARSAGTPALR